MYFYSESLILSLHSLHSRVENSIFYGKETESEGTFGGVSCTDAGCEAP